MKKPSKEKETIKTVKERQPRQSFSSSRSESHTSRKSSSRESHNSRTDSRDTYSLEESLTALAVAPSTSTETVDNEILRAQITTFLSRYPKPDVLPLCLRDFDSPDYPWNSAHSCKYCPWIGKLQEDLHESTTVETIKCILLYYFLPRDIRTIIRAKVVEALEGTDEDFEGEHQVGAGYRFPKLLGLLRGDREEFGELHFGEGSYFTFDNDQCLYRWVRVVASEHLQHIEDIRMVYFVKLDTNKPGVFGTCESMAEVRRYRMMRHKFVSDELVRMGFKDLAARALHVEVHITHEPEHRLEKLLYGPHHAQEPTLGFEDSKDLRRLAKQCNEKPKSARVRSPKSDPLNPLWG